MPLHTRELSAGDLPAAIDRALTGRSILILPRSRTGAIAEVDPDSWTGAGTAPALILFTSGSTGAAKAVALSASALTASARATERALSGPGDWHLSLPINHIAGFQVELRARLAGRTPIRSTSAGFRAESFAVEIEELLSRAGDRPTYTSLVPTQLHRILDHERAAAAAGRIDHILLGGSAISPALLARAESAGLAIVRTYGMSETAGGCVYNGVPFDEVTVTITAAGTIDLAGAVIADAYVDIDDAGTITPADSAALHRDDHGIRVMHTSDLGRLEDGVLSVLGRADDIIVSGGTNVSPHALETGLLPTWQMQGIAEMLVTSVPDEEWGERIVALARLTGDGVGAVAGEVTARRDSPDELARYLTGLDHGMGEQILPRQVFIVDELPSRSIGKPDRRAAARTATELADASVKASAGESAGEVPEYPRK